VGNDVLVYFYLSAGDDSVWKNSLGPQLTLPVIGGRPIAKIRGRVKAGWLTTLFLSIYPSIHTAEH
jgi:hypothetical protein